jgi:hypothetical protein
MRKKKMHIILIAHEAPITINCEDGSYYQKTGIHAQSGDNTNVRALLEARCHNVIYLRGEDKKAQEKRGLMATEGKSGRKYALGQPTQRMLYTQAQGNFFAKSRANLENCYEIEESENETDLLKNKSNPSIIKFFEELYK